MTEPEAEALAARMLRVWAPFQRISSSLFKGHWSFAVWITQGVALYINVDPSSNSPLFEMCGPGHDSRAAGFIYDEEINYRGGQELEEFTNKWLPYFRRGLWLSGLPIDATAHEKVEWIQGFTREEIDAWNLKF